MQTEQELHSDHLRRLLEVGPWLLARLDLETVLDRLLQIARETTGAQFAALGVLDPDREQIREFVSRGMTTAKAKRIGPHPGGRGILGVLITDPRPLRLRDLTAHPDFSGFPPGHPEMHSFLGVPILIDGIAWGNLYLTDKSGDQDFSLEDEETIMTLAAWAGVAIEHARALADAQERERGQARILRRLQAMQTVAAAVGAETGLDKVLELIVDQCCALLDAEAAALVLGSSDVLMLEASAGRATAVEERRQVTSDSTIGDVLASCTPLRIDKVARESRLNVAELGVGDVRTALLVPLVYRGEALGVIAAFDPHNDVHFDDEDEQIMTAFAASAATAVATAQSILANRLRDTLEAAEAERKHWARELHDETLQALGALKMMASGARRAPDGDQRTRILDQLVDGLDLEIENLHAIISALRPAALDDLGLRPAIEALAQQQQISSGLDVRLRLRLPDPTKSERRLRPELEVAIYRLVQEALSNVAKHAGATEASVTVKTEKAGVNVEVSDDGSGFDTAEPVSLPGHGFGITGMRERVELVGGHLAISSSADGTTVSAVLPVAYVRDGRSDAEFEAEEKAAADRESLSRFWRRRTRSHR